MALKSLYLIFLGHKFISNTVHLQTWVPFQIPTQVPPSGSIVKLRPFAGDPHHPSLRCDQHQWVRSVGMTHCKCTCSGLDKCEWTGRMSNGGLTYGHVWRILAWHGNRRCHSLSVMQHHQQAWPMVPRHLPETPPKNGRREQATQGVIRCL